MSAGDEKPVVLVTGAARRVGARIARTVHAAGARVVIHYRNAVGDATALVDELNGHRPNSASAVAGDLAQWGTPERIVEIAVGAFGRLDGLVNNASSFHSTPLGEITQRDWDDLIGSNLKGPLFLLQAAAPWLRAARGAVVNVVDIHAERPLAGYPVYSVAKAGLLGLTRAMARELAPEVRVNGVAPGAILWPEDSQFPPDERTRIVSQSLLQRAGSPHDIAEVVRFLLFDAAYVTGQMLAVDGGRSIFL